MLEGINQREVIFDNFRANKGKCIICGRDTELKLRIIYNETGEKESFYFDLCENCKLVKNCFTCRYSKCWYLRYKANCDINFENLILHSIFEDGNKEAFEKVLKKYDLEDIDRSMEMTPFLEILKVKQKEKIEKRLSDCNIYKTKRFGNSIKDYWNHPICKRYQKGDATKEEWSDYHGDYNWEDELYL